MAGWSNTDKRMLKEYVKPIAHMRRQFEAKRFSLIFGTGFTQPVGIPGWKKINEMIAQDPEVEGINLLGRPTEDKVEDFLNNETVETIARLIGVGPEETITTQKLYEHFKKKKYKQKDPSEYHTPGLEADVYREWKNIIRVKLYANALPSDKILRKHKYLRNFITILRNSPLTVTYNFDDILEMALSDKRTNDRGYETVTSIQIPLRRNSAVIYHPNGYIPRNKMEEKSLEIVLSENEFANRMLEMTTGQYNSLLHHFTQNTCLLIGLSLKDGILKNLLKQSAMLAPGNYHYYVHYCGKDNHLGNEEENAIRSTNFETYNLITLFLNDEELSSIGKLISDGYNKNTGQVNDNSILSLAKSIGVDPSFCFYIIGAVGAGKSTCVSHFRNLVSYDEWREDRLRELGESWRKIEKLSEPEKKRIKKKIDKWIAEQFYEKNQDLIKNKVGISICDRCPLDPIAFTPESERKKKARYLLKNICLGRTNQTIKRGHVIMLYYDPEHLDIRARRSHGKYRKGDLKKMQDDLQKIYNVDGITVIDSRFLSFYDIIKRISRIIHMAEPYKPANIHGRLVEIKKRGL